VQFITIFLKQGHSMTNYIGMKDLFNFLRVLNNPHYIWSHSTRWKIGYTKFDFDLYFTCCPKCQVYCCLMWYVMKSPQMTTNHEWMFICCVHVNTKNLLFLVLPRASLETSTPSSHTLEIFFHVNLLLLNICFCLCF
jgi:hypothetical protein